MIDPGTGLALLGSAIGGKKLIEKILGPSADYIGEQLKEWTQKKVENSSKIFKNAEGKLGDKINEDGSVPPKVLKGILEEGAWCEEELQIEYFGGVLASSRSGISRDDRGAYFISLISRLSTYQLRMHYLIYHSLKENFNGQDLNIGAGQDRENMELFIPFDTYQDAMDFSLEEVPNSWDLLTHSIWGIAKEELIENTFQYGEKDSLLKNSKKVYDAGMIVSPSSLGVELFMWAYGYGQKRTNNFFKESIVFNNDQKIELGKTMKTK
ncbi:MAG: hypothetical protein ABIP51_21905 [Bacteroidia bacterium]